MFSLFLLLLCPFLSLPFIFHNIYYNNKSAFILLAFFMAAYSFYFVPSGDQFRYWLYFYHYIEDYMSDISLTNFSLPYILMWLIHSMHGSYELFRGIVVLISYLLFIHIYFDMQERFEFQKKYNPQECFLIFLIYFLIIPYFSLVTGLRFGFGLCICIYSIYQLFVCQNTKWASVCGILSSLSHPFFAFFIPFLLIIKALYKSTILCMLFSCIYLIFMLIFMTRSSFCQSLLEVYISSDSMWKTGDIGDVLGRNAMLGVYIQTLFTFLAIIALFFTAFANLPWQTDESIPHLKQIRAFTVLTVFLYFVFFSYFTIQGRLGVFLSVLIPMFIIMLILVHKIKTFYLLLFFGYMFLLFSFRFMSFRTPRSVGYEYKFLYSTFFQDVTMHYDEDFIYKNINIEDGSVFITNK